MKMLENWLPPDDAGNAVACIATSFTFDSAFFSEDCLSRFLSVSTRDPDGASGLDIAGMLEEEERLAESQVTVLVDQSCRPDARNLRWDLLPVRVPGGLLHAKVAVLMWQDCTRVILGSANLTTAGYRQQVEIALSFDLGEACPVPRAVFQELALELRSILSLVPGDSSRPGPIRRATENLDLFEQRVASANLKEGAPSGFRFSLAPTSRGKKPLDRLDDVWNGAPPQSVVGLSPFWDGTPDMPGATAVLKRLSDRAPSGGSTRARFVVPVDATAGKQVVLAPAHLQRIFPKRLDAGVVAFAGPEDRRLHAKCLQYTTKTWTATMFGSSNLTAKGLGIDPRPHREINLWIGCKTGTPEAKVLARLIPQGDVLDGDLEWAEGTDDEDETALDPLPSGFGEALITSRTSIELGFTGGKLPAMWKVAMTVPGGADLTVLDESAYLDAGSPKLLPVALSPDIEHLPAVLEVSWQQSGETRHAVWIVNVGDGSVLPPPAELRALSVEVLLAVLASTRPLRAAFEEATRAQHKRATNGADELDPLKRFDSSGFLLQRTRRSSAALFGVERRLSQRISSMDALEWRLAGTLGPEHIAAKLVEAAGTTPGLAGEAEFLLAELALTVSRIPWTSLAGAQPLEQVKARVSRSIEAIRQHAQTLITGDIQASVLRYVDAAFAEALR